MRSEEPVLPVGGIHNLVGSSEGNRLLGRPSRRWGDDIKVDIEERGWGFWNVGWIQVTPDRVNAATL